MRLTGLCLVVNVLYKGANLGSKCCFTRYFFSADRLRTCLRTGVVCTLSVHEKHKKNCGKIALRLAKEC